MGLVIFVGLVVSGWVVCWLMSFLLWVIIFGCCEVVLKWLEVEFVGWFCYYVMVFLVVYVWFIVYLISIDVDVWLIIGLLQLLVEQVYCDIFWLLWVNLIVSCIVCCWGGWVLILCCLGYEKVVQLEKKIGVLLWLYSGYSDSEQDNLLFGFCQYCWWVIFQGEFQQLE